MPIVKNLTDEDLVTQVANDRTVTVPPSGEAELSEKDATSVKYFHGDKVEVVSEASEDEAKEIPAKCAVCGKKETAKVHAEDGGDHAFEPEVV